LKLEEERREYQDRRNYFKLIGFKGSTALPVTAHHSRVRDEAWAQLAAWLGDGGAIPEDYQTAAELHAPSWYRLEKGPSKVTPKEQIRKELGRSPDGADALLIAVYRRERTDYGAGAAYSVSTDAQQAEPLVDSF
jgi:hypothetical protein